MRVAIILRMVRRTITIPDEIENRVRSDSGESESFSATVARLLDEALANRSSESKLAWIGSWDSGDPELAFRVEEVLAELGANADVND